MDVRQSADPRAQAGQQGPAGAGLAAPMAIDEPPAAQGPAAGGGGAPALAAAAAADLAHGDHPKKQVRARWQQAPRSAGAARPARGQGRAGVHAGAAARSRTGPPPAA